MGRFIQFYINTRFILLKIAHNTSALTDVANQFHGLYTAKNAVYRELYVPLKFS